MEVANLTKTDAFGRFLRTSWSHYILDILTTTLRLSEQNSFFYNNLKHITTTLRLAEQNSFFYNNLNNFNSSYNAYDRQCFCSKIFQLIHSIYQLIYHGSLCLQSIHIDNNNNGSYQLWKNYVCNQFKSITL